MAFEPSYNILDKDTHNTLVEALKSGGIGYTEADGTVHKISDTYGGGGSSLPEVTADDNGDVLTVVSGEWAKAAPSGGGGGFDAVIKYAQDESENWVYTLLEGSYSIAKAKLSTGVPVALIGTYTTEEVEGIHMEGYAEVSVGAVMLATYTGGECLMITTSSTLYWLPDGTISEQPPEPPK